MGRRAFVPLPSCTVIPEASEAVCNPHTVSFGFPDANEAACIPHAASFDLSDANEMVCNPHSVSFGLPDANERCATHTLLSSSFFLSPIVWGGFFPVTTRTRRCEVHTPPHSRSIIPPGDSLSMTGRCDIHHTAPISFRLTPPIMGGFSFLQPR